MRIHPGAKAFALTAESYERARPSYPAEAIDWALSAAELATGDTVVDLAAGTGKLTRLLVERGLRVVAVEPIEEMRRQLAAVVQDVDARPGTAERIPTEDESARAVTVAQAFHWFDERRALPEIARVLAPGGSLVIFANRRDPGDPLQQALGDLIRPYRTTYPNPHWDDTLAANEWFDEPRKTTFPNEQLLDRATVVERIASVSWIGALADDERQRVLDEARALVADRDEPIRIPYITQVFVCRRR